MWRRKRRKLPDPTSVRIITDTTVALARHLSASERDRLDEITMELIASKRWEAVGDIDVTHEVLVTIASNAAIPILEIGTGLYRSVASILVQPRSRRSTGIRSGPVAGVVSDAPMRVVGEATADQGPISISWAQARADSRRPEAGRNVVIHELAHKMDMAQGNLNGVPPMVERAAMSWEATLDDELQRTVARESDAALRAYAWTNRAEFFAVATETFFCTPTALRDNKPVVYDHLATFFRQDPAEREGPEPIIPS